MEPRKFTGAEGLGLMADVGGDPKNPAVLLLHGGGQTRRSWNDAARALEVGGWHVASLDLRGHGESDWSPDANYDLDHHVADLRAVLRQMPSMPAVVGASLGGMTALVAIGEADTPIARALVLVDIAPKIESSGAARIAGFMRSAPDGFASVDEAADAVAAYLPHRPRPADTSGLRHNLRLRNGRYYWHWDPSMFGAGRMAPRNLDRLEAAARRVAIPTLLVRGALSEILSDEGVEHFLRLVPGAEHVSVEGAGHMVAGDKNDRFNTAVLDFLQRSMPRSS